MNAGDRSEKGNKGRRGMRVFTNDCEWCVAESVEDVVRLMDEYGYGEQDPEAWGPMDDAETISIHCDADGDPTEPGGDDDAGVVTRTAAEWAQLRGPGFLCTTEW
jgi:hypothetical protein